MNEHKNIITIEDEIKEFSDKPVKSSALFKALEEKGVPDSSEASAGDVLSLDEDKKPTWAAGMTEPFVVNLTPTAVDLTAGTMDKTVGEITAAWQEGQKVMFKINIPGQGGREIFCQEAAYDANYAYPSCNAVVVMNYGGTPRLAWLFTGITSDPDKKTWTAAFFDLV